MKIQFDTPLLDTNGKALSSADLAALTYTAFIDTVNPPVKSYPIPAAAILRGSPNPDGSLHITVDAEADLGVVLVENVEYFIDLTDSLGNQTSLPTQVLTFTNTVTPASPQNPSVG